MNTVYFRMTIKNIPVPVLGNTIKPLNWFLHFINISWKMKSELVELHLIEIHNQTTQLYQPFLENEKCVSRASLLIHLPVKRGLKLYQVFCT